MQSDDYEQWIAPLQSRMVNCVWRIVRDPADSDDVMQEALLQVLRRFDVIRRHPNPTALVLRICTNKALDHLRRQQRRREVAEPLSPDTASSGPSPRQALQQTEQRAQLLAFIATLPVREAEAITLHVLEDMDYPAVAAAMDCRESTVRVLVGRARERFRAAFRSAAPANPAAGDAPAGRDARRHATDTTSEFSRD